MTTVPEAAVDSALNAVFSSSELSRYVWGPTIQKILEAAAPHMLTTKVIQAAAVEAAAKAHLEARGEAEWRDLTTRGRDDRLYWMRAALEAAAQHMTGALE